MCKFKISLFMQEAFGENSLIIGLVGRGPIGSGIFEEQKAFLSHHQAVALQKNGHQGIVHLPSPGGHHPLQIVDWTADNVDMTRFDVALCKKKEFP